MKQSFTTNALLKITRKKEIIKFDLGREQQDWKKEISLVADVIKEDNFKLDLDVIETKIINNKDIYYTDSIYAYYAIKKISNDLKRLYKIDTQNRDDISEQVLKLLETSFAYSILRLDVKSFYESINYEKILRKLKDDKLLASKSFKILEDLKKKGTSGLLRGLSISPVMSEIYMRNIDRKIREIPGVYYYARYVDDIFILSTKKYDDLIESIKKVFSDNYLSLNNKCYYKNIPKIDEKKFNCSFDYLGYKYNISCASQNGIRKVQVSLADDKIRKIKTRIVHSLLDHACSSGSKREKSALLKLRIDILSGNYPLPSDKSRYGTLKGGIYFSNRLITNPSIFKEFNRFLKKALYTRKNNFFGKAMKKISTEDKKLIQNICFKQGFEQKKFLDIDSLKMQKIKSCWKYKNHKRIKKS